MEDTIVASKSDRKAKKTDAREPAGSKRTTAEVRRALLIQHTRSLMRQEGLQGLRLNEIVRLAGGSKASVVRHFGNKDGLIAAALEESARETMLPLFHSADMDKDDVLQGLTGFLDGLLRFYLQPEALAIYRGVIASAGTFDAVARIFYRYGHEIVVEELERFLNLWGKHRIRDDISLPEAAGRLTHMLRSGLYERVLLGLEELPVADAVIAQTAKDTAALFLTGAAPR